MSDFCSSGKKGYLSKTEVKRVIKLLNKERLRPYICQECNRFHITSNPPHRVRRMKEKRDKIDWSGYDEGA